MNPWGITDTEAAMLDALCELYSIPRAAEALGLTIGAARSRIRYAGFRMAGHKPGSRHIVAGVLPVSTIELCLRWSNWTAAHCEAVAKCGQLTSAAE